MSEINPIVVIGAGPARLGVASPLSEYGMQTEHLTGRQYVDHFHDIANIYDLQI